MFKKIQIVLCFLSLFVFAIFYKLSLQSGSIFSSMPTAKRLLIQEDIMSHSRSIIFVETTDRLEPPPLVSCSVESAARIYPDRPVVFFMKGLNNSTRLGSKSTYAALNLLSAMKNVFIFPFQFETLFQETPLLPWYHKVNANHEKYWVHVSSDASRLTLIWKYGGIYMDTDIISIRPIPLTNFLAAEDLTVSSSAIFSFSHHHWFIWDCMKDFVQNYHGDIWGHQGPLLIMRRLKALCKIPNFHNVEDQRCHNISFLHPHRFYPIPCSAWKQYYRVWDTIPDFNNSYGLHLWNYMNKEHRTPVAGTNTLAENLYKTYCPTTYKVLIQGTEGSGHKQQDKTE